MLAASVADAQDLQTRIVQPPAVPVEPSPSDDSVDFSANALDYDSNADIVTASGDVRMAAGSPP